MDLRLTEDEIAFRAEVRAFMRDNLPASIREKMVAGRTPLQGRLCALDAHSRRQRLGRPALAAGMGRRRMEPDPTLDLSR